MAENKTPVHFYLLKYGSKYGFLASLFLYLLIACSGDSEDAEKTAILPPPVYPTETAGLSGQQLAQTYCQACHLFPEPALLDKKTWENGVLPNMALRLGIGSPEANPFARMTMMESYLVREAGTFADSARISATDWKKIVDYYLSEAPESPLPQDAKDSIQCFLPGFSVRTPAFNQGQVPLTTLTKFDTLHASLLIGDRRGKLFRMDGHCQVLDSLQLDSPPSNVYFRQDGSVRLLTMGKMDPSDEPLGQLLSLSTPELGANSPVTILKELPRPVQYASADLNEDGREDLIVCGFGNYVGRFSWYEQLENQQYREHVLKQLPGARQAIVRDLNSDGLPDLVVLMTQGTEGVFIYYNQGKGRFREEVVLRFPPVYGSSYIELADFNADGAPDILYTNGDNADYSYSLKKYHGVRIFLNDGTNQFRQTWFYPMHGASKALARDFDGDGDLDLAAISFFPDENQKPYQGFLYFENQGSLQFAAQTFESADQGKWMTMDAADFDQDGDTDIVLGSFLMEWRNRLPANEIVHKPSVMILFNNRFQAAQ
jgi:hypothetical protein